MRQLCSMQEQGIQGGWVGKLNDDGWPVPHVFSHHLKWEQTHTYVRQQSSVNIIRNPKWKTCVFSCVVTDLCISLFIYANSIQMTVGSTRWIAYSLHSTACLNTFTVPKVISWTSGLMPHPQEGAELLLPHRTTNLGQIYVTGSMSIHTSPVLSHSLPLIQLVLCVLYLM